uniref:Helicase ATP-binding domain-containing protein n=1 Tax=Periophthalmus magnuspinnatus TaxID=409849 RepID=A0A3B4B7U2_9GOBI
HHSTTSKVCMCMCVQNCILADEMGLGKTIQSIALLSEIYNAGIQGPFLVIAPLSTITNWEREFSTWTHMNAIMYCKDDKFDALITTFEMVLSDCPELREISWRCVIIDEAHRLKNRNCKLLDSLKMLDLVRFLLTGTPLQNTVEELFSLLHFLEPAQFPSEFEFLREFGDLKTEEQVFAVHTFKTIKAGLGILWYSIDIIVRYIFLSNIMS